MVEPFSLVEVEAGAALRAVSEREVANELVHAQYFAAVAWIPAQESHKVDHSLGQESRFAVASPDFFAFFALVAPFEREHRESELLAVALA